MKKIFLFLVIFALSFGAKAQSWTPIFGKQRFASGLGVPVKDSTYFAGTADSALVYINPKDAGFYYKYKGYHKKIGAGTVSSVGLTMPSAFSVSGSPITNNGSFIVTGAGSITQYIRGDGSLATFPSLTGYVPYTGATGNVNLGEYGISGGYVGLDTTPTGTPTGLGTLSWDSFYRTASLIDGTGVTNLQIGQEERVLVHNNTGATLTDGQVVYVTGSTGELPSVALASNTTEATSSVTFGIVTESIANGADGFITTSGLIHGLNTNAYTEGAAIWLGSTAGTFTETKPVAPANSVLVGYVIKKAGGNGSIFVKIQNGNELEELHDVLISSVANNQGLFYESSSSLWKNKSIATVLGYTPEQPLTFSAPLSRSTNTVSIPAATGSVNGYLSSTDWTTFNSKQAQLNGTGFVKASGTTISYDNSTYALDADVVKLAGAQTITGVKTFSGAGNIFTQNTNFQDRIYLKSPSTSTYTSVGGDVDKLLIGVVGATHSFAFSENTNYTYTFPAVSGTVALTSNLSSYVPYTGATGNVNLGNNDITAGSFTGGTASFATSGAGAAVGINHSSGAGIALNISKSGSGEGIYVNKTSGTGNAVTIIGTLNATTIVKNGGTSSQYLMADGSVSTLTNPITGTGTSGQVPLFNGTQSVTNSQIYDNGNTVSIGNSVTSPNRLVSFSTNASGFAILGSGSGGAGGVYAAVTSGSGNMFQGSTSNGGYFISDNAGNTYISGKMGIGTFSSSSYNLNVVGTGYFSGQLWASLASSGTPLRIDVVNGNNVTSNTKLAIGTGGQYGSQTNKKFLDIDFNGYNNYTQARIRSWDESGSTGYGSLYFYTNSNAGTDANYLALKLDYTGAATFSSSVTAGGVINANQSIILGGTTNNINSDNSLLLYSGNNNVYLQGSGGLQLFESSARNNGIGIQSNISFFLSNSERMRITSGGLVGINTTTPFNFGSGSGMLDVRSQSVGAVSGIFVSNSDATARLTMYINNAATATIGTSTNHAVQFVTNDTERMRLTIGGNLIIGGTTDYGYKLQLNNSGNSSSAGYVLYSQYYGGIAAVNATSSAYYAFKVRNGSDAQTATGTDIFTVRADGAIFAPAVYSFTTGTVANVVVFSDGSMQRSTVSSARFKDNITDWNASGLNTILALKPKEFTYKQGYYKYPNKKFLGLIAEEVAEVSSYLADFENEDGSGKVENVRYANIVVPLIKAIQEQQAQIKELNQKITNLEVQIKQ